MVSSPPPLPPLFLPPPPPPTLRPLLYYFLVVVATAALALALYSVIVLRWCSEQQQHRHHPRDQSSDDHHPIENFRLVSSFKFKKELDYKVRDHEQGYEPPECSICLSVFEEDDELKRLPRCMHCFHANCIDKWLISHLNCPLCRLEVVESMDERRSKETNQLPYAIFFCSCAMWTCFFFHQPKGPKPVINPHSEASSSSS